MDIGKAFSFVFEDEKWITKVLIGGLLFLFSWLIIPFLIVIGYMIEIVNKTASDSKELLPEWTNIGNKLTKGFVVFIIYFLYGLPIVFLSIIYSIIIGVLNTSASAPEGQTVIGTIIGLLSLFLMLVIVIYSIALILILPVAIIKYAVSLNFSEAFNLKENWKFVRENITNLILVLVLSYVAQIIGSLGFIALFIGAAFTSFYALAVIGNLYGQLAKVGLKKPEIVTVDEIA